MASLKRAGRTVKKDIASLMTSYPSWAHPDVRYAELDWQKLRDCYNGEREVKDQAEDYLPRPSGMEKDDYTFYLENATFFNMTARTVGALVGTIFRRNPLVSNLPDKFAKKIQRIGKKSESFRAFSRGTAKEQIHMGRYGVLVDRGQGVSDEPYMVGYIAESILDWKTEVIDGREVPTEVVLMEIAEKSRTNQSPRNFGSIYRVLRLVDGVYQQHIYESATNDGYPDIDKPADKVITPTNRGVPFNRIPFEFFGPESNGWDYERSPMLDIVRMNLSHYRSYAHLEHGRFYTGLPVYWASTSDNGGNSEYRIGPSVVWELPAGQNAGLIEFNGQGLKFLENAITKKESHIATLGGRLIGVDGQATSESDNQVAMKDRNEQALLLNVALSLDEGFTRLIQHWLIWQDVTPAEAEKVTITFNKDFLLKEVAAREFRAIHAMYKDGILPIEVVHDYLMRGDVIPDWISLEQFKILLENPDSFPNQPDAQARDEGFPNRATQLELEESDADRTSTEDLARESQTHQLRMQRNQLSSAERTARTQASAAKAAAKAAGKQAPNNPANKKLNENAE